MICKTNSAQQKEFTARVTEIRAVQAARRQRLEVLFPSTLHRTVNGDL